MRNLRAYTEATRITFYISTLAGRYEETKTIEGWTGITGSELREIHELGSTASEAATAIDFLVGGRLERAHKAWMDEAMESGWAVVPG